MTAGTAFGRPFGARLLQAASILALFAVTFACESAPRVCTDLTFTAAAEQELSQAATRLDFEPLRPCARFGSFTVSSIYVDVIPRGTREPRISFVAASRSEEAFVWSQTRDQVSFTAIPAGTHHVTVAVGDVRARGFAGPSGNGVDTAYLRWRSGEITYELAATLRPWLTETAVIDLAEGLMERAADRP